MIVEDVHGIPAAQLLRWGNPWHGQFEAGGLRRSTDGVLMAGSQCNGPETCLVAFSGLPDPVTTSAAAARGMLWRKDAILYGPSRRYSPFGQAGIGPLSWLYRASDGAVWRLTIIDDCDQWNYAPKALDTTFRLQVKAQRFGVFAPVGAPAAAQTTVLDHSEAFHVPGGAPVFYFGHEIAGAGYSWPRSLLSCAADGSAAVLTVRHSHTTELWNLGAGVQSMPYRSVCGQALWVVKLSVTGGSASTAPAVDWTTLFAEDTNFSGGYNIIWPDWVPTDGVTRGIVFAASFDGTTPLLWGLNLRYVAESSTVEVYLTRGGSVLAGPWYNGQVGVASRLPALLSDNVFSLSQDTGSPQDPAGPYDWPIAIDHAWAADGSSIACALTGMRNTLHPDSLISVAWNPLTGVIGDPATVKGWA